MILIHGSFHELKSTITDISLGFMSAILFTPPTTVSDTVCGDGKTRIPLTLFITLTGISAIIRV